MAKKFEIIGSALVVTDTSDSDKIILEMPKRDAFHNYEKLESDNRVKIYDTNGTSLRADGVADYELSECVDSNDTPFTKGTFQAFVRDNLGFNTAPGGSGAHTDTIVGGVSGIGQNTTNAASYANNAALEPPAMINSGKIKGLSINLTVALSGGTCEVQITINGVAQTGVGQTLLLTAGGTDKKDTIVFETPIPYNAKDAVGLQTVTIGASPTGSDATLMLKTEDT